MNKELSADTNLSHYRIVEKIGAGGMGEIYLAEDTKLKRKVALKVLPSDVASNQDRMRRFTQEAEAAAALNHPSIAHIYEIGEGEGTHFIAMEYVEGVTLNEKIHREKTDLRKLLKYLIQIAEGLAKAHSAGIVHRDLKPDNIMLSSDGYAKILDFGLAKLVEPQTSSGKLSDSTGESETAILPQHSTPGMILGTLGYMSPEQAQGKVREIDHRSDIFSFGCILFETATGRKAFAGKDALDSLHKIVHAPTPQIQDTNPDAPQDLQRIVRRCLQKEPDKRYQSIKEVAIELDELRQELKDKAALEYSVQPESSEIESSISSHQAKTDSAGLSAAGTTEKESVHTTSSAEYIAGEIKRHKRGFLIALSILLVAAIGFGSWFYANRPASNDARQINSIAVLPFKNESGYQDVEYLSDGMTETLINSLSQLPNLSVKARSSVFRYKGKEVDPKKIAAELNVQAILTGRVVQRGEQITLNLELIDAQTENVLWGNRYERKSSDLVSLQSEIARDVSQKLKTKLSGADAQKIAKTYTTNPEAYRLYLRGRFYWNKREEKDFRKAVEYYNQAVALDPNYALAYAGLADTYALLFSYGFVPPTEAIPKAREFARQALSLDDGLAEPHATLGYMSAQHEYDFARAEREFKRAIELNPNYAIAHQWYGELLTEVGRFDEASAEFRRALEIEPLSLPANWEFSRMLYLSRRYDESFAQHQKTIELDYSFARAHRTLAELYQLKGDYANAVEERARFLELSGQAQNAALVRETFARSGWNGYLRLVTGENSPFKDGNNSFMLAKAYLALGEKDKAIAELNKAYENRISSVSYFKVEPQLDPLRGDPRYQELLKKIGFP